MSDLSCQKRLVCELYREAGDLGELGRRGVHGLDLVFAAGDISTYVTVPVPVVNALDELKVPNKFDSHSLGLS